MCKWIAMLLIASSAQAVELRIHHSVIKKILAEQVFTDDGRKYVKANRAAKCSYAYLENPEIGEEKGRLKIRARFSGRSAQDFFGRCIGLGDSFLVAITAIPYYEAGFIRLRGVNVASEARDGIYIRRVRAALTENLSKQFSYGVMMDAKKILEEQREKAAYRQEMMSFQVSQIRVTGEALVLTLDFVLDVR
jgi:hypothetical protein